MNPPCPLSSMMSSCSKVENAAATMYRVPGDEDGAAETRSAILMTPGVFGRSNGGTYRVTCQLEPSNSSVTVSP